MNTCEENNVSICKALAHAHTRTHTHAHAHTFLIVEKRRNQMSPSAELVNAVVLICGCSIHQNFPNSKCLLNCFNLISNRKVCRNFVLFHSFLYLYSSFFGGVEFFSFCFFFSRCKIYFKISKLLAKELQRLLY